MQDYFGFSYFRKPVGIMNEDESIFCDDESRLEFMKRIFKGRLVPLLIIFFMVIIPQLIMQYRLEAYGLVIMYVVLLILYLSIFIWYAKQYRGFKSRIYKS
jgi:threonine/homoserine/homoserine lactone efflux protein